MARISGISVRALHYYEEIGLLVPSARSDAGYRLYDDGDVLRLQQIVLHRALGLSLEEIRRVLDDPRHDRRRALLEQRERLQQQMQGTHRMLAAIDAALALMDGYEEKEPMDMNKIFDGFEPNRYAEEAEQRWGDTEAYKESMRRTQSYTQEDWQRLAVEQGAVYTELAQALRQGKAPNDPEVQALVERHRLVIDRWFYPCSPAMQRKLADLYHGDPRFAENIDKYGQGVAAFLSQAIRAANSETSK